jgi:hypothetical protein
MKEMKELDNLQNYRTALWLEIRTLFNLYCDISRKQQEREERAVARAAFFNLFGAFEIQNKINAAAAYIVGEYYESGEKLYPYDGDQPVKELTKEEKLFLLKHNSFEEAWIIYPKIYAGLFGLKADIEENSIQWQKLLKLKRFRDLGAETDPSKSESRYVTLDDLENLLTLRRWYLDQLKQLPWTAGTHAREEIIVIKILLDQLAKERVHFV